MSSLVTWLGAGGGATVLTSGVGTVIVRLAKRIARDVANVLVEDVKADLVELKVDFAKQVGGNSNGLRQKLDEVGKDVAAVKTNVSNLSGRFDQHILEGGSK